MEERVKKYFENPRKITHVKPDTNYTLFITFDNGEVKKYEMINELYGVFAVLKDVEKFQSVFIDEVGNVAWDIDENIDSSIHWKIVLIYAKICSIWKVYHCKFYMENKHLLGLSGTCPI